MGKTKKTGNLVNVVVTDIDNNVTLPKALTLGEQPLLTDNSLKVPTTSWVNDKLDTNGLPSGGTTGQLLAKQSNTDYDVIWTSKAPYTSVVKHTVKAGETLTKGQAIYVSGADGTNMIVTKASNTTETTSSKTMGLIAQTLSNNGQGEVVTEGLLAGLNTSTATIGDPVWLGTNGNLIYGLTNKPYAPAHLVFIGIVTRVSATVGEIFVKVQNGFELNEIHDVDLKTNVPVNGEVLGFDGTLWVNKTIASWLGFTPVTSARTLTINGTAQDLSANRSWSVGTVTSVAALTLGTTGTDLSSSVATGTTTPVITLNVPTASSSNRGALSAADWTTFNAKQAQLNGTGFVKVSGNTVSYDNSTYLTTISGITAGGELAGTYPNPTLVNNAVVGKVLTGLNVTGTSITATDSILTAFGKLQNQINSLIGSSIYQGTWNASINTPTLTSSVGTKGFYYIVSVAGSTNLNGIIDWGVGDWAIYDGTAWQKVDNTDSVSSVNGFTGAVSLTTSNITEGTNLYYTNARSIASVLTGYISGTGTISATDTILQAIQKLNGNIGALTTTNVAEGTRLYYTDTRARAAISLTTTGASGSSTYNSTTGVLNVPAYTFTGLGATTFGLNLITFPNPDSTTNLYIRINTDNTISALTAANFRGAIGAGTITSVGLTSTTSGVTIGSSPITTSGNITLAIATASGSQQGLLSSTDWNTFNNKQNALTNPVTGTGFVKANGTTISYDNNTYLTGITGTQVTTALGYTPYNSTNPNGYISGLSWAGISSKPTTLSGFGITDAYPLSGNPSGFLTGITSGQVTTALGYTPYNATNPSAYITQAGARSALSLTTTGNSGASTYNSTTGVINVPNYTLAGLGGQPLLTNPVTGTGTTNYLSKFTGASTLGNSLLFDNGTNVGLGTTSPTAKLQVESSNITAFIKSTSNPVPISIFNSGSTVSTIGFKGSTTTNEYVVRAGADADNFVAYTNDTERLRITSSGNVGIGTTAPAEKLDVNGGNFRLNGSNANSKLFIYNNYNGGAVGISMVNTSNVSVIDFNSNVGSGTFAGNVTASAFFASSDERLKDITSKDGDVISYKWKDGRDDKLHFGYSAQQIENVNSYLVNKDDKGFLSVNYTEVLVLKVRELEKQVAELKSKLN